MDLLDITREFGPYAHRAVIRAIVAEMLLIEDEIEVRKVPKKAKRVKSAPVTDDSLAGMDELADIYLNSEDDGDS